LCAFGSYRVFVLFCFVFVFVFCLCLKENANILRDLSMLQAQRQQFEAFAETRRKILMAKSNLRVNWLAFAVANHLVGRHDQAVSILDTYVKTVEDVRYPLFLPLLLFLLVLIRE